MRLCRQIKGGDKYVVQIESFYNVLIEKQQASEQAKFEKEGTYDDVVLNDRDLDSAVRTLFEKAKQYDRENPGCPLLIRLFPDGKVSSIIYASLKDEPTIVEQLISRIDALGKEHPLQTEKTGLHTNIDKCRAALTAYHDAIRAQKTVEALEEIAQADLRRQYEFNYLDIAKDYGKRYANRFFPAISSASKISPDEEAEELEITEYR